MNFGKLGLLSLLSLVLTVTACNRRDTDDSLTKTRGKDGRNTGANATGNNKGTGELIEAQLSEKDEELVKTIREFSDIKKIKDQTNEVADIYGQLVKIFRKDEASSVDTTPLVVINKALKSLLETNRIVIKAETDRYILSQNKSDKNASVFKLVVSRNRTKPTTLYYGPSNIDNESQKVAQWEVVQNEIKFVFGFDTQVLSKIVQFSNQYLAKTTCVVKMLEDTEGVEDSTCSSIPFVTTSNSYILADTFKFNTVTEEVTVEGNNYVDNSRVQSHDTTISKTKFEINIKELYAPDAVTQAPVVVPPPAEVSPVKESDNTPNDYQTEEYKQWALEQAQIVEEQKKQEEESNPYKSKEYSDWLEQNTKPQADASGAPEEAADDENAAPVDLTPTEDRVEE